MTDDYAALDALAAAALTFAASEGIPPTAWTDLDTLIEDGWTETGAAFVAAASPDVIRRLIADLRYLRSRGAWDKADKVGFYANTQEARADAAHETLVAMARDMAALSAAKDAAEAEVARLTSFDAFPEWVSLLRNGTDTPLTDSQRLDLANILVAHRWSEYRLIRDLDEARRQVAELTALNDKTYSDHLVQMGRVEAQVAERDAVIARVRALCRDSSQRGVGKTYPVVHVNAVLRALDEKGETDAQPHA
jgi:hypothetical protein